MTDEIAFILLYSIGLAIILAQPVYWAWVIVSSRRYIVVGAHTVAIFTFGVLFVIIVATAEELREQTVIESWIDNQLYAQCIADGKRSYECYAFLNSR